MEQVIFSIIIPTKNEEKFLPRCLKAIKNAEIDNYEIVVVDNFSSDATVEIAKKLRCTVIRNPEPKPSRSRNLGASIAKGVYLVFIDADCLVPAKWFRITCDLLSSGNIVAAGTKICPDFNHATWVEKTVFDLNDRRGSPISNSVVKVKWIGTSNMIVKKSVFTKIGGFNEQLETAEDFELCRKLLSEGDILLEKSVYTIHLRESKTLSELFRRELWRGKDSFPNWVKNSCNLYEAPSVLFPLFYFILLLSALVSLFFSMKNSMFFFLSSLVFPIIYVARVKNKILPNVIKRLLVSSTYLLARSVAIMRSLHRCFVVKSE